MARLKIDRDALNMASPHQVAMASMAVLNGLQERRPEIQVLGAAATFLSLCTHLGIPAQEAFTVTKNLINGDDGKRSEFRAIDLYMAGELA